MTAAAIAAAAIAAPSSWLARIEGGNDADVNDHLASAVEDAVHECAELARGVGRPCEGAVEEVEGRAEADHEPGNQPQLHHGEHCAGNRDAEADQRQRVGREARCA